MDLAKLSLAERQALAADASTDPSVLLALASDVLLAGRLIGNPSTPRDLREELLREFPHLRNTASSPSSGGGQGDPLERARRRQALANETYSRQSAGAARIAHAGQRQVQQRGASYTTNAFAIVSLVLGLIGASVLAIVFGHIAKRQIDHSGEQGDGMATAGLVLGYLGLVITVFVLAGMVS